MPHHGIATLILAWAKNTFGEVFSDPIERAARVLAKDPAIWRLKHNDKVAAGTSTALAAGTSTALAEVP